MASTTEKTVKQTVKLTLTEAQRERLLARAHALERSVAWVVNKAVLEALERAEKTDNAAL